MKLARLTLGALQLFVTFAVSRCSSSHSSNEREWRQDLGRVRLLYASPLEFRVHLSSTG